MWKRKKLLLFVFVFFVSLAAVPKIGSLLRDYRIKGTLTDFYAALYVSAEAGTMALSLVPEKRLSFEQALTMAGAVPQFYLYYSRRAKELLGEDFSIAVRITETRQPDEGQLKQLLSDYEGADLGLYVTYDVIFSPRGGAPKKFTNKMPMVRRGGKWYMTTHLSLPIGLNIDAY